MKRQNWKKKQLIHEKIKELREISEDEKYDPCFEEKHFINMDYDFFKKSIFFQYPQELFEQFEDIFVTECILSFLPPELKFSGEEIMKTYEEIDQTFNVRTFNDVKDFRQDFDMDVLCCKYNCPIEFGHPPWRVDYELPQEIPYLLPESNKFLLPPVFFIKILCEFLDWEPDWPESMIFFRSWERIHFWTHQDIVYIIHEEKIGHRPTGNSDGYYDHFTRYEYTIWSVKINEFVKIFRSLHEMSFFNSRKTKLKTLEKKYFTSHEFDTHYF